MLGQEVHEAHFGEGGGGGNTCHPRLWHEYYGSTDWKKWQRLGKVFRSGDCRSPDAIVTKKNC